MQFFVRHKLQVFALASILLAILMMRGGLQALAGLGRTLVPLVFAFLILRFAKRKLMQHLPPLHEMAGAGRNTKFSNDQPGKTIDLCPKCGTYLQAGHRCRPSTRSV